MINKTLGGDRIGSGNKMQVRMHNYERSSHNLSQGWKSSMQVGVIYPFLCIPALRGDKFEIGLQAGVRTVPSKGALFGSYKLQIDLYQCPVRLYTGLLHNNPTNMGLKMNQVYYPQIDFTFGKTANMGRNCEFSKSSLMHYLGLSGIGYGYGAGTSVKRAINAIPFLAYYDIFKNYYSNKQEENAYVFSNDSGVMLWAGAETPDNVLEVTEEEFQDKTRQLIVYDTGDATQIQIDGEYIDASNIFVQVMSGDDIVKEFYINNRRQNYISNLQNDGVEITFDVVSGYEYKFWNMTDASVLENTQLKPFPLKNLDEMRMELLSWHEFGAPYKINDYDGEPYNTLTKIRPTWLEPTALEGLVVKTYQSDIFNNWLSEETIKTVNEIAKITAVDVAESGGLTIDALNFAEKMYNLLNRIAVSGNTYEDWQDVVYEETPKPHIESPMYLGGLSQEVVFEEVIANAATEGTPLGSIGGRGIARYRKGGKVTVKVNEGSYIIGLVSLTPRINYSQGNEFYMTEIQTPDDWHKPGLDGIGFQDLIGERMAYFDTHLQVLGGQNYATIERHSIGKVPAWLEYMTAVDKVHADFAEGDLSYMVLDRDYEQDEDTKLIKDSTTYIDPSKYNYVFANAAIDAQNFWAQIETQITARRKMSAKLIPNI